MSDRAAILLVFFGIDAVGIGVLHLVADAQFRPYARVGSAVLLFATVIVILLLRHLGVLR